MSAWLPITSRPQPRSRLAEGHPKGPGLDHGKDDTIINSADTAPNPDMLVPLDSYAPWDI